MAWTSLKMSSNIFWELFAFQQAAEFSKPVYICTCLGADLTFFCKWLHIFKTFSPFCEKLQNAKKCSSERHYFKCSKLWTKWFYSDGCWVEQIFLVSAIMCTEVLTVALSYSFGITLQSFDSLYFQAWHHIIKLFSSTSYSVQKLAEEALFNEFEIWLWKASSYWTWNHFQTCTSVSFLDIYLHLMISLF